jgi:N-methylhydantoinase A
MDLGQQYARTRFRDLTQVEPDIVNAIYAEMRDEAQGSFGRIGVRAADLRFGATVDMRYSGQFHEVEIELPDGPVDRAALDGLVQRFHDRYEVLNGYQLPWQPVEFLTFYLKVTSARAPLEIATEDMGTPDADAARRGTRSCLLDDGWHDTPVFDGELLRPGTVLEGPALVDDPTTTVLVLPGFTCDVDPHRNLVLHAREIATAPAATRLVAAGRGGTT